MLVLRLRVSDGDAGVEEGELIIRRHKDVAGMEVTMHKVVNLRRSNRRHNNGCAGDNSGGQLVAMRTDGSYAVPFPACNSRRV